MAPPTKMDEKQLISEGYYSTFGEVGARVEMPGRGLHSSTFQLNLSSF